MAPNKLAQVAKLAPGKQSDVQLSDLMSPSDAPGLEILVQELCYVTTHEEFKIPVVDLTE